MRKVRQADFLRGRTWTAKQASIINCTTPELAVDGGRRFGKTYTCAPAFLRRIFRRHALAAARVRSGELKPWGGAGLPPRLARHQEPHVQAAVLTPRERHLEQCRQYIMSYFTGTYRRFQHPKLALTDAGRQMWFYFNGVASRIRFVTGSGVAAVVSNALDELWIDEAGLLDGMIVDAVRPVLWERNGGLMASGTPSLGVEHWFSQLCLAGLDPDHPYYVPDVVERDPRVTTVIGTSYEAFDRNVRVRARADAKRMGEAWEAQWVRGDWRLPSLFVYDNWDPQSHVIAYDPRTRHFPGRVRPLPPPQLTLGVIDWAYSTTRPGAAVVFHVWLRNPLDPDRTRPLVIAIDDRQEAREYNAGGWYQIFHDLYAEHRIQRWYADPSRDELLIQARRNSGRIGPVKPAEKADKGGRINLLKSLLGSYDDTPPAFYVSDRCTHLPRQFGSYRWKLDPLKNPTDKPIDYDDHCLDCCAFLMGSIIRGGHVIPHISL